MAGPPSASLVASHNLVTPSKRRWAVRRGQAATLSQLQFRLALNGFDVSRTIVALCADSTFLYFLQETCVWLLGKEEIVGMLYVHTERSVRSFDWHRLLWVRVKKTGLKKRALSFCKRP